MYLWYFFHFFYNIFLFKFKVHAYIIAELKEEMPSVFGKEAKKKELIKNLNKTYEKIQRTHNISLGDFPDINRMRDVLENLDFGTFKPLDKRLIERVDNMLATDITQLMQMLPKEENQSSTDTASRVRGGAFEDETGPFGFGKSEGVNAGVGEEDWIVARNRKPWDDTFPTLHPVNGKISGASAKSELVKSKLPNSVLAKVWRLSDVDADGYLDIDEWALANYLVKLKLDGFEIPNALPEHLIPPAKRRLFPTLNSADANPNTITHIVQVMQY